MLEERLEEEFGLVSAWHAFKPGAPEPSTLYFRWKKEQGFHIDYCFIPKRWVPLIKDVSVPEFGGRAWRSDHRPMIVEIDVPRRRGLTSPLNHHRGALLAPAVGRRMARSRPMAALNFAAAGCVDACSLERSWRSSPRRIVFAWSISRTVPRH